MLTIIADNQSTFTGYLLYVETGNGERVGIFDKSDTNVGSPVATCPGAADATASHTSLGPSSASGITIPWTPPATDVGAVFVKSIVLSGQRGQRNKQQFYFPTVIELQPDLDFVFSGNFEL